MIFSLDSDLTTSNFRLWVRACVRLSSKPSRAINSHLQTFFLLLTLLTFFDPSNGLGVENFNVNPLRKVLCGTGGYTKMAIILGVPKKLEFRISVLYGFYCAMWAFRGLLNILGGSYIKIKYCQAKLRLVNE